MKKLPAKKAATTLLLVLITIVLGLFYVGISVENEIWAMLCIIALTTLLVLLGAARREL